MMLATVTCEKDLDIMLLQAESIQKFVEPCTHLVAINDPNPDLSLWRKRLLPYYTKHELILKHYGWKEWPVKWYDSIAGYDGWHSQQVYKFLMYKDIKTDYLLLDSKNIFIKPTDIYEWQKENVRGCGALEQISQNRKPKFWKSVCRYSRYFGVKPKSTILKIQTPFYFKKEVLDKINNLDAFCRWFSDQKCHPSEFMAYSIIARDDMKDFKHIRKHLTMWPKDTVLDNYPVQKDGMPLDLNVKVLGLHRRFLQNISDNDLNRLNTLLEKLGFKNKLKKPVDNKR